MKKPAIIIGGGLAVLVAVVVIALVVVWSNLDSIVKAAIEEVGSDATQASVTVDNVGLDIPNGSGSISGLVVGNPSGFEAPNAFNLGSISVKLDTGSVTGDTILINEIIVDAPKLTYELTGDGNNIGALRKNVEEYAKQFSSGSGGQASSGGGGEGAQKKLIIERLVLKNGSVAIRAPLANVELSQPLPEVVLTDIGKQTGGAHAAEVAQQVFAAVSSAVGSAVSNSALTKMLSEQGGAVLEALKGGLGDGLGAGGAAMESLGKQLEGLTQGLTGGGSGGSGGSAADDAKKAIEGVGDQLKGILGR